MTEAILLLALLLSTGCSSFFSGVETGIYALNRVRLRVRAEEGDSRARRIAELIARPQLLISTILIGNHLANFAASFFSQSFLVIIFGLENPEVVNTLLLTPFLFVFGEITPKNVFRTRANRLVYTVSGLLAGACRILRFPALLLRWLGLLSGALPRTRPPADEMLARDRLEGLFREVVEEGVLTGDQGRMVRNVLSLASVPVRDTMVALPAVDTLEEGFDRKALLAVSQKHGRTRIPVRRKGGGEFLGVVNVLDLVYAPEVEVGDLLRIVPRIPASHSVEQALRALRKARVVMGFVRQQGGEVIGIVTVKDLVEEVFGELPVF